MPARFFVILFYTLLVVGATRLLFHDQAIWARVVGALLLLYGVTLLIIAFKEGL